MNVNRENIDILKVSKLLHYKQINLIYTSIITSETRLECTTLYMVEYVIIIRHVYSYGVFVPKVFYQLVSVEIKWRAFFFWCTRVLRQFCSLESTWHSTNGKIIN